MYVWYMDVHTPASPGLSHDLVQAYGRDLMVIICLGIYVLVWNLWKGAGPQSVHGVEEGGRTFQIHDR